MNYTFIPHIAQFNIMIRLLLAILFIGNYLWVNAADQVPVTIALELKQFTLVGSHKVVRVRQGDRVKLNWQSDKVAKIHLHGYDIEKQLSPGKVTSLSFDAYATGRFPVNLHRPGKSRGGHHGTPLLFVEVMPR
jgi:hypothetical protein